MNRKPHIIIFNPDKMRPGAGEGRSAEILAKTDAGAAIGERMRFCAASGGTR